MAWARIDDNMPEHPKVVDVGAAAELVAYRAICYANRYLTDGVIPFGALGGLTTRLEGLLPDPPEMIGVRLAARLVAAGLWHRTRRGFVIHDYLDYNFSRADIAAQRARNRAAGNQSAQIRATTRSTRRQHVVDKVFNTSPGVDASCVSHDALDDNVSRAQIDAEKRRNSATGKQSAPLRATTRSTLRQRLVNPSPTPTPVDSSKESTPPKPPTGGSGAPRIAPHSNNGADPARDLLAFLNLKSGHTYRPVTSTLDLIRARLASGATPDQVRSVIAAKWREWRGDPDRARFLRPETLFRASKFESYLGQLPPRPDEEV